MTQLPLDSSVLAFILTVIGIADCTCLKVHERVSLLLDLNTRFAILHLDRCDRALAKNRKQFHMIQI